MRVSLYTTYWSQVGDFEIPPYNGYPDVLLVGDKIYVHQGGPYTGKYKEAHVVHLKEEDRRDDESTH